MVLGVNYHEMHKISGATRQAGKSSRLSWEAPNQIKEQNLWLLKMWCTESEPHTTTLNHIKEQNLCLLKKGCTEIEPHTATGTRKVWSTGERHRL